MTHPEILLAESTGYGFGHADSVGYDESDVENMMDEIHADPDSYGLFLYRIMAGSDSKLYLRKLRSVAVEMLERAL